MNQLIAKFATIFQLGITPFLPAFFTPTAPIVLLDPIASVYKTTAKISTLHQINVEAIKTVDPVDVPQSTAPPPQTQSSTDNLANSVVPGCGDNAQANFIYMHESGCRLIAPNGSGCDGIGQACPASKIYNACPNMDYACQNAFFTNYANRYGGWAGAYTFWIANSWW